MEVIEVSLHDDPHQSYLQRLAIQCRESSAADLQRRLHQRALDFGYLALVDEAQPCAAGPQFNAVLAHRLIKPPPDTQTKRVIVRRVESGPQGLRQVRAILLDIECIVMVDAELPCTHVLHAGGKP